MMSSVPSNSFAVQIASAVVANKPGDSIPALTQLVDKDGAVWTFVNKHAFRNGADTNQPFVDTDHLYINLSGSVWLHSNDHGYRCWTGAWTWGTCGPDGNF